MFNIHFRSFFENHTPFHSKMNKIYTRFQIDTAAKTYPLGRHIPIYCLYKGVSSLEAWLFHFAFWLIL